MEDPYDKIINEIKMFWIYFCMTLIMFILWIIEDVFCFTLGRETDLSYWKMLPIIFVFAALFQWFNMKITKRVQIRFKKNVKKEKE